MNEASSLPELKFKEFLDLPPLYMQNSFICELIFKIFVALFTDFGMQKDDKVTFFGCVSEQGVMQKGMQLPTDVVRRLGNILHCL